MAADRMMRIVRCGMDQPRALAAKVARIMDGSRRQVWLAILPIAAATIAPGCNRPLLVPALSDRLRPVNEHFQLQSWSDSTSTLLEGLGLAELAGRHPRDAFFRLERTTEDDGGDYRRLLALAELADDIGRRAPPWSSETVWWSRDAAVYAVFCLTELDESQPGAFTACVAREVHNRALARCLRAAKTHSMSGVNATSWSARLGAAGILSVATTPEWTTLGFDTLQPSQHYTLLGPEPLGCREGLGVPLIARRGFAMAEQAVWKPYGPGDAVFAATAVIRPRGTFANWRELPVELVLHDPVREQTANVDGRMYPLAGDLTSPLIGRLTQSPMQHYEYRGALDAETYSTWAGVYALDPYQAGKIPVVLVHGLWSNPSVWIPMLDALRSDPVLLASYQFWVALYPSRDPLPLAALSLRRSLREVRRTLDPQGIDPALDQMVIVAKSTGGQATRMLVQPSGDALWNAVFTRPINQINAPPELLGELTALFFSHPEPYLRRVIFVTTAHRGGKLARSLPLRLGVKLIHRHDPLRPAWTLLEALNSRSVFQPFFQNQPPSSVDGMEEGNPLLTAIDGQAIAPNIRYHSIIANIRHDSTPERMNDGLVGYLSAHLDGAASEQIVHANHVCEANQEVIAEVRRILHVNLNERDAAPVGNGNVRPEASTIQR
jgi:triacylglycerol esterase/lipase EstA (alpha/beta hydrolase family)